MRPRGCAGHRTPGRAPFPQLHVFAKSGRSRCAQVILHIQEPIRYFDSSFERVEEVDTELARLETGVRRRVNELFEQGGFSEVDRRRVSIAVSGGKPHSEIIRFAVENDIDLVVMGTHGYTGMKAILIGSVAERVVRFAPCQVLCVKPDDYRSPLTDGIG